MIATTQRHRIMSITTKTLPKLDILREAARTLHIICAYALERTLQLFWFCSPYCMCLILCTVPGKGMWFTQSDANTCSCLVLLCIIYMHMYSIYTSMDVL